MVGDTGELAKRLRLSQKRCGAYEVSVKLLMSWLGSGVVIKLYHTSRLKGLEYLSPQMPCEDIWEGRIVFLRTLKRPCVCFAGDLGHNFICNYTRRGYIYEAQTDKIPREIYKEVPATVTAKACDFKLTKEHRFYMGVTVKMVGEFQMATSSTGMIPLVEWYEELDGSTT